jgi:ribonucleoside-diphosphate reductase alpha chain
MLTIKTPNMEALDYFANNDLSSSCFLNKYGLRDTDHNLLEPTPHKMHVRIAKELARIEKNKFKQPLTHKQIFSYLDRFEHIIPQGSPMFGIGNPYQLVSLSNCFVIESPHDSYGGIHKTDEELTQISKRRGGVGLDISTLRPSGCITRNAARTSTGAVTFASRYSNSIREVAQNGRRGALLISMSVHHPDIMEFIHAKSDLKKITGANISVRLTDEFLNAIEQGIVYEQRWPVDSANPQISRMVDACEIWDQIIYNAWAHAEPGLLFWDNIIRESPADCYADFGFGTQSTNPCAELPLCPYDSCRLLILNLFGCTVHPFTKNAYFDYDRFYNNAQVAQRLMDDIIDLEIESIDKIINKVKHDPEPEDIKIRELNLWNKVRYMCEIGRRTGTGITALGDVFAALGIRYGSEESIHITDKIYRTLKLGCYRSSVDMAKELGAFKIYDPKLELDNPFINRIKEEDYGLWKEMQKYGRRNIALLTTAPCGTSSMLASLKRKYFGTTSGIEPVYTISHNRRKKINADDFTSQVDFVDDSGDKWQEFDVYHSGVKLWMDITGETDITKSPYYDSEADKIDWINRVRLQAVAHRHVDHSMSSTINLPEHTPPKVVSDIYTTAWKSGCKGITVYRDKCRSGVLNKKPKCQSCKSENLIKENGCTYCKDCAWSLCSI